VEADQQRQWEDRVNKRPSWKTLVANKRMALGVVYLSGEHPRFAHSRRTSYCYYLLSHGRLVSSARYAQMLEELSDPKLHHKFAGQLDRLAPKATVFRESGTWRNYHSDSVMVLGTPWRNYILVALVESANSEKIIQPLLPQVEALLHAPVSNATLVSSMRT
jgi:predicted MPP superfamily phosphohydrolase